MTFAPHGSSHRIGQPLSWGSSSGPSRTVPPPASTAVFEAAGRLDPDVMRSLDAIHLAAALELGDELKGMVTCDERLAVACTANGVTVLAPTA